MINWDEDGFQDEAQLVYAIRTQLLTPEQRKKLFDWDITIEDLLNGRVEGADQADKYSYFFDAWNAKIGRKVFGF